MNTRPQFSPADAERILQKQYGIAGKTRPLPSYDDQNFQVITADASYVLKISSLADTVDLLSLQNRAMAHLQTTLGNVCMKPIPTNDGQLITTASQNEQTYLLRLLTWVDGTPYGKIDTLSPNFHHNLGRFTGQIDLALASITHPASQRISIWDLAQAHLIHPYLSAIADPARRAMVTRFLDEYERRVQPQLPDLRQQIIHNDVNEYNVLSDGEQITGIIDFGDVIHSAMVCEIAIAAAYAMLGQDNGQQEVAWQTAVSVISGYHSVNPLTEQEVELLFNLVTMRLCTSVTMSSHHAKLEPENEYIPISAKAAWAALTALDAINPDAALTQLRQGCGFPMPTIPLSNAEIITLRERHLAPSLSLSYNDPLHIVRGRGQYLYAENGRCYLDAVNNVPHVGHNHPRVVEAGQRQMALLNTNSRYLHATIVSYAARLAALFPDPLSVVYFVNSGSEANELALRLARTHTGRHDLIAIDGAYHGNTGELINISSYKFAGAGGQGAPPYVRTVPMPDPYRGEFKGYGVENGRLYAQSIHNTIAQMENPPAAFIAEALLGCGGQIVLPDGYLAAAYAHARAAGALCIADEVQIGFGRVGSHWWGFQTQGVVPDIVTLGKPMGNGHPLAAVVTTPAIARSFANGMEYFNTFGGNAVSCAIGTAVLDVIEDENLRENALAVGDYLLNGLRHLQTQFPLIGDVRGRGLYIGAELVRDQQTLEPADTEATFIANKMKEAGVLISTDGPFHNVLKIKPPLVFTKVNADELLRELTAVLQKHFPIDG